MSFSPGLSDPERPETARRIDTEADLAEGCAWLAARDPALARVYALTGLPPLRRRPGGFPALMQAICAQQVSVASAAAIWSRILAAGGDDAACVRAMSEEDLRGLGLSRPKVRYALALAEAELDYDRLTRMPTTEAIATLTAIKGIGIWTAEVYLKFSEGRADVFAAGDLALQEGVRLIYELGERPGEKELRQRALAWSPWRAVAARLIWDYYRINKQRSGIME